MAEQEHAAPAAPPLAAARLHEMAHLLREARYLGPEGRVALADFTDELAEHLAFAPAAAAKQERLARAAGGLVEILRREAQSPLAETRDRLEETLVAVETRAPTIAGLARQLLDALAKLGI